MRAPHRCRVSTRFIGEQPIATLCVAQDVLERSLNVRHAKELRSDLLVFVGKAIGLDTAGVGNVIGPMHTHTRTRINTHTPP